MAVTQNPIIGMSRKSVGNVSFRTWRGLNIIQAKPLRVKDTYSDAKQAQRNCMVLIVYVYRRIKAAVLDGLINFVLPRDQYTWFLSLNLVGATDKSAAPSVSLIPASMVISSGIIGVTSMSPTIPSPGDAFLEIGWAPTPAPANGAASDLIFVVIWNETLNEWYAEGHASGIIRSDALDHIVLPFSWDTGHNGHVWTGFIRADFAEVSDNSYNSFAV